MMVKEQEKFMQLKNVMQTNNSTLFFSFFQKTVDIRIKHLMFVILVVWRLSLKKLCKSNTGFVFFKLKLSSDSMNL